MAIYTMADLHLSLGADKSMEVFPGWENYTERIRENWQSTVSSDDTVVVGGDISWGMNFSQSEPDFEFLNSLNGKKILLKGNHDYWWETKTKIERFFAERGFDTLNILFNNHYAYGRFGICGTRGWINEKKDETPDKKVLLREAGRLEASVKSALSAGLEPIVFLHYPPIYYSERNDEILAVLHEYNIKKCFYGHIHGVGHRGALNGIAEGIHFKLVSADWLRFKPLDITGDFES